MLPPPACGKITPVERREFLELAALTGAGTVTGLTPDQVRRLLGAVSQESVGHAAAIELPNVGSTALDGLRAQVQHLSVSYVTQPPLSCFSEMVSLRDGLHQLLQGQQRPQQSSELHLMLGQVSCLLSVATLDLGNPYDAGGHARAAFAYGEAIGHDELRAWARATESCAARYAGRLPDSVRLAREGQRYAGRGDVLGRLYDLEARALAQMGDAAAVRVAERAPEVVGTADSDIAGVTGGEFGVSQARLAYGRGGTYLALGRYEEARMESQRALTLYSQHPPEDRSYGCEALARLNLANAHLRDGQLDGVQTVLEPVFGLPDTHRLQIYSDGLLEISDHLARPELRSPSADQLAERIAVLRSCLPHGGPPTLLLA